MQPVNDRPKGFTQIPNALIDNPALSIRDKMVLIKLARHGYGKTTVYPSQVEIAKSLGIRRETVKAALDSLTALGVVQPHGKGHSGKQETYTIDLASAANLTIQSAGYEGPNLTVSPCKPDGLTVQPDDSVGIKHKAEENELNNNADSTLPSTLRRYADPGSPSRQYACPAQYEEPDDSVVRLTPAGPLGKSKAQINELLLTPDGKIALDSYDDLNYDLNSLTLPMLGSKWIPEPELTKLVDLRGVRYCSFWMSWLPRKIASEYAKGKPVNNPAGLYRRAVEQSWEVDPAWPTFDETQHTSAARAYKKQDSDDAQPVYQPAPWDEVSDDAPAYDSLVPF